MDFFTPIVDDPFWFGQIAAANALSDVYAMGGVPKTAMNLVGFPIKDMDLSVFRSMIEGGLVKLREAGVVLLGGHSVEDKELKYGLSVTGFIHPDRILTKKNVRPGDQLILTKSLGTGVINTAIKGNMAPPELIERVTRLMAALNRRAAEVMSRFAVHACTDITGFGFLGHLCEMVEGSGFGAVVHASRIPIIPEALDYGGMGLFPAGAYRNKEFRICMVDAPSDLDPVVLDLLFDPQTSGGLLMSVPADPAQDLVSALLQEGVDCAALVGEIVSEPCGRIVVDTS